MTDLVPYYEETMRLLVGSCANYDIVPFLYYWFN